MKVYLLSGTIVGICTYPYGGIKHTVVYPSLNNLGGPFQCISYTGVFLNSCVHVIFLDWDKMSE